METLQPVSAQEHLQRFIEQARRRGIAQQRPQCFERRHRGRVDVHVQLGRQSCRAQHAYRVFAIACFRIADQAQHAVVQVLHAAHVIADGEIADVVIHRVDAEVAADRVLLDRAPDVVAHDAPVDDAAVAIATLLAQAPKSRNLDDFRAEHHMRQAEATADQAAVAEQVLHLVRGGAGGHVEVLRRQAQQQIAHGTADQVGGVAGFIQAIQHAQRRLADVLARDDVLIARDDLQRGWGVGS